MVVRQTILLPILFLSSVANAGAVAGPAPTPPISAPAQAQPLASPAPPTAPPATSTNPRSAMIESATAGQPLSAVGPSDVVIKAEVLLDREGFSPGAIDGQPGLNLTRALTAFEHARRLPGAGALDASILQMLAKLDPAPITQTYVISAGDLAGPFLGKVPKDFAEMAKLKTLGFADPVEELAERFHMSQALLRDLNPTADFSAAGAALLVVRPSSGKLAVPVAMVVVDKSANQVRALDAAGKVLAMFPATVGSTERPAPSGRWAVKVVVRNPDYTYDPKRLTFGKRGQGVLTIPPGPNNPVGSTWIALTTPTYGIHGSPDPTLVGKTASHGCVRLTNWDAATLGGALKKGVPVVFVGATTKG
jgi:lipoprotein-anchoring transpeptidase ErfK/SrfK